MRRKQTVQIVLAVIVASLFPSVCKSAEVDPVYLRIKAAIDKIGIIDDHEHLRPEPSLYANGAPDFFDLVGRSYVGSDIAMMGNTFQRDERYLDKSLAVTERWTSFQPIYNRLKNTGYMRSVRLGIRKVHGIELTDAASIEKINESMRKLYGPGVYKRVLQDIGNIDCVLVYRGWNHGFFPEKDGFPDFFQGVCYIDRKIMFTVPEDIHVLEEEYGKPIHHLEDFEPVYRDFVKESKASRIVGFKTAAAYIRTLDFSSFSRDRAEDQLRKLLTFTKGAWMRGEALTIEDGTDLSNYCMHTMLKVIEEHDMPISFHTGLQTNGRDDIRHSDPQLLIPLLAEHRNVNFDLFHGGFPYMTEFIELGKSWPNAYLNLCWSHIITPEGTRRQLSEMIECVPVYKILAFGGDVSLPELTIGHLEIAKENCARVLTEKVRYGYFTEAEAIEYAERILRTNACELFKLDLPD